MTKIYFYLCVTFLALWAVGCGGVECTQVKDGYYQNQDGIYYNIKDGLPTVFLYAWQCSRITDCGQNNWTCKDGVDPDENVLMVVDGNNIIMTITPPGTTEILTPVN